MIFIIGFWRRCCCRDCERRAQSQRAANAMEIANIVKAIEQYYQDKGDYPPSFEEDYSTTNRENTILAAAPEQVLSEDDAEFAEWVVRSARYPQAHA